MNEWWKHTIFYQIYMPSFCDGNGDGIGDFVGIRSKLEYLKQLGVGCVWLTPFYPSPKVDQGYDVSDYENVDPDYGTLEDFRAFVRQAHELGIRVLADVVMNHTSTEHAWFKESRSSRSNPKRDWYIWKEPVNGAEPNNWESFFGEEAWELDKTTGMYYYHSFAKEQADLNWANPEVKQAMFRMLDFWMDLGVDGFRLDVINNLSLTGCMTDNPVGPDGEQIHQYDMNQPGIRQFMRELRAHVKRRGSIFLVGEISSDKLDVIRPYADDDLLDTTFNFNLGSMERFDFDAFVRELGRMADEYNGEHLPTIFFGSHDMPRFPSRFGFDDAQARNLFTLLMTFRAYPFIYFGDEIGMDNYVCRSIDDARDIQGVIAYHKAKRENKPEEECLRALNLASRDHSRNTMYWNDIAWGGFSAVQPWIGWQPQSVPSAEVQRKDPDSLFSYLAGLARLRAELPVLALGDCRIECPAPEVLVCRRSMPGQKLVSVMNFSGRPAELTLEDGWELQKTTRRGAAELRDGTLALRAKSGAILLNKTEDRT